MYREVIPFARTKDGGFREGLSKGRDCSITTRIPNKEYHPAKET